MVFSEEYFNEEERCGFVVPEMMKRAWAAEIELVKLVEKICIENGLTYYADFGTLLGAVRHKGFIPWDDDIDISMKRADYMKFIDIAKKTLPKDYEITGMYADNEEARHTEYMHTRLTTQANNLDYKEFVRRYHGFPANLGIDIFVLDYLPADKEFRDLQTAILTTIGVTMGIYKVPSRLDEAVGYIRKIEDMCRVSIDLNGNVLRQLQLLYDNMSSLCRENEANEMTCFQEMITQKLYVFDKKWFERIEKLPFEETTIWAPAGYDGVLKEEYGNYMEMIRGTATHNYPFYKDGVRQMEEQLQKRGYQGDILSYTKSLL